MRENQLDPIDLLILKELTSDARVPFTQLSKKLKVSNTLIHQRVKKLKEAGIIKKAIYMLNPSTLGYQTSAYTQIMLTNSKLHREVEFELQKIPEIVECVNISGRYALLVKIYARNNKHLRDIIYERILTIEGVEGTNSTICFETVFGRNVPLELED
ncbi:MAG: Lrp/AsnC family transcriptional regulator [Chitinophagales bacterium]